MTSFDTNTPLYRFSSTIVLTFACMCGCVYVYRVSLAIHSIPWKMKCQPRSQHKQLLEIGRDKIQQHRTANSENDSRSNYYYYYYSLEFRRAVRDKVV